MNLDELERLLRDSKAGMLETESELIDESYYAMYNAAPELIALARAGDRLAEATEWRVKVAFVGYDVLDALAEWKAARGDTT